jgi:hypothetical protein
MDCRLTVSCSTGTFLKLLLTSLFPRKRTKTLADVGLSERARDSEIVGEVWDRNLTIVTGNGDDFVREINIFQGRTTRAICHDLYGLIVLPNGYEHQKRLLQGALALRYCFAIKLTSLPVDNAPNVPSIWTGTVCWIGTDAGEGLALIA